ncbi:MAG TPA: M64 family metallopeptidase, partial [Saprospiraceae bacterium]|nr:M64 family metallopeptidase [Saprospiraceae bacterium]
MRIGVLLILALFVIYNAYGQPLKVNWIFPAVKQDPVISLSNPEIIKRINLVILGDGYSYSEFTKFDGDVLNLVSKIFSVEPFINYREYFNVISVAVNSQESGVNHPQTSLDSRCKEYPSKAVRNYFNSRLDYGGTHRLIYVDSAKVEDALRAVGLSLICNQAIVLVNDPEYGGAGGKMAAVSTNSQSADIFVHEVGHSLFDLRDEYWVNSQSAIEAYNMTKVHNEYTVSWKNWLGINGVGMYEYYDSNNRPTGWYKPHQKCMMQFLGNKFCSVCREGIILGIHGATDIIYYTLEPRNALYIENKNLYDIKKFPVQFDVLLNKPFPNTLRSFWKLNGDIIANQTSNIKIYENELKEGINELEFYVRDTSSYLKLEGKSSAIQKACTSRRSYILNYKATKSSFLFLFDLSGSMNEFGGSQTISKLEQAKVASKITLNRMQSNNIGLTDEVAVLGFAGDCTQDPTILVSDFETDFMLIQNRI